jgi:hypothetical protein
MEIRETSRPLSPFVLNHDLIGHQINWVLSGYGRAFLPTPVQERGEPGEVLDPLHVVMLGFGRELADRHVFDHARRSALMACSVMGMLLS